MNALHPGPTSASVIRDIFAVHFPKAESVLDLTYGKGAFWKWDWRGKFTLHANVFHTLPPATDASLVAATHWDFTAVPKTAEWQLFDVVIFDPPFSAMGPASKGGNGHSERYGAARHANGPQNISQVWGLLEDGIKSAVRLARHGIIVKTQAVIESGKYHDSPFLAKRTLRQCGWVIDDEVFFAPHRRPQPPKRRIQHFHNRPSVFIVGKA